MTAPVSDADLAYSGRERRRPPGASAMTQRIYGMLVDHPEGMTRAQIHEELRDGWLDTDAYRAYDQFLRTHRSIVSKRKGIIPLDYGSAEFKRRAQLWWITHRLGNMKQARTARKEGSGRDALWFAGDRAPTRMAACEAQRVHLIPLDPDQARAAARSDNTRHQRREAVREALLERLNDGRVKGRTKDVLQLAYDYVTGR